MVTEPKPITSLEIAEDIYKALHLSIRNDLYEAERHRKFIQTVEPVIHDALEYNERLGVR